MRVCVYMQGRRKRENYNATTKVVRWWQALLTVRSYNITMKLSLFNEGKRISS